MDVPQLPDTSSSLSWNEWERHLDATSASKEARRCYQQAKTVSPAWFAGHVACLSDCTGADSVRGTPGRPEGWAANGSTWKRCSQRHAVWWVLTVSTMTAKTTFKTDFLFFFFLQHFEHLCCGKFLCMEDLSYCECGKFFQYRWLR